MRIKYLLFLFLFLPISLFAQGGGVGSKGSLNVSGGIGGSSSSLPTLAQNTCYGTVNAIANPSGTCTFSSNATSGHTLVLWQWGSTNLTSFNAPTGCASSWAVAGTPANQQSMYIGTVNSTGSCAITYSGSSTADATIQVIIFELLNTVATLDGTPVYSTANCGTCTSSSITTTNNNSIVLGFMTFTSGTNGVMQSPWTVDSGSTPLLNTGAQYIVFGHLVVTTAGATSMTWSPGSNTFYALIGIKA